MRRWPVRGRRAAAATAALLAGVLSVRAGTLRCDAFTDAGTRCPNPALLVPSGSSWSVVISGHCETGFPTLGSGTQCLQTCPNGTSAASGHEGALSCADGVSAGTPLACVEGKSGSEGSSACQHARQAGKGRQPIICCTASSAPLILCADFAGCPLFPAPKHTASCEIRETAIVTACVAAHVSPASAWPPDTARAG